VYGPGFAMVIWLSLVVQKTKQQKEKEKKTPANEKVITIAFDSSTFRARQGQIF
jgi:hypothetical protein